MGSAQHKGCARITPSLLCCDSNPQWHLNYHHRSFLATSILCCCVAILLLLFCGSLGLLLYQVTASWKELRNLFVCVRAHARVCVCVREPKSCLSLLSYFLTDSLVNIPFSTSSLRLFSSSFCVYQESKGQFGEWELSSYCSSWVGPNTAVGECPFEIQPRVRHTVAPLLAVKHHSSSPTTAGQINPFWMYVRPKGYPRYLFWTGVAEYNGM